MTIRLEHSEVNVDIVDLAEGKRSISVEPKNALVHVPIRYYETAYPLQLIEQILAVKGPFVLDEIRREEDPAYVRSSLEETFFLYAKPADFRGGRLLDFGCGCGASTVILARMFPHTRVVGVDLVENFVNLAQARANYYRLDNFEVWLSPSEKDLPAQIGEFDFVLLSAVYEHLLPGERAPLLQKLWHVLKHGGVLYLNQTPNRYFPLEKHTTGLPLLNYVPDRLALNMARWFSSRVPRDDTWENLLRKGVRGGSEQEIMGYLPGDARLLRPHGCADSIDVWYALTPGRQRLAKQMMRLVCKGVYRVSEVALVPYHLSLAIKKIG